MNVFQSVPIASLLGAATSRVASSVFESHDSLRTFAQLAESTLASIVDALSLELIKELLQLSQSLRSAYDVMDANAASKAHGSSKFSGTTLIVGSVRDFYESLHGRLGQGPSLDFEKAMKSEHCERLDSRVAFTTSNYNLLTEPALEWSYAVDGVAPPHEQLLDKDGRAVRTIRTIDELMQLDIVKKAGLHRAEVISVSLYTGPMFAKYNSCLRQGTGGAKGKNMFATTIFVLVSAVQKISRVTEISEELVLYCGLGNVSDLPEHFHRPDEFGSKGWTEFGFRSTTADKSVAIDYCGIKKGNPYPMVITIKPNSVDRGACISDLSQYQGEKEYLFVPCSFLQPNGPPAIEIVAQGIVHVIPVHLSANLKTETLDELLEKKKRLHLASARAAVEELRWQLEHWATGAQAEGRLQRDPTRDQCGTFTAASFVASIIEQFEVVVNRHSHLSAEEYVDDGDFRALVGELLDTKAWAKEKVQLWLLDDSQFIRFLQFMSLRDCHRLWLFFIHKCITGASAGFSNDMSASVELLKSRGLVRKAVKGEANIDGEDVLVHAGADGWSAGDIAAAVTAGADVFARSVLDGTNGLWKSARYGHLESLNALILAGCDVENQDTNGSTAIYSAARAGNADCVKSLLSAQANMHIRNADGCSPLHAAAGNGHADCLALLLEAKGNVATCSNLGESPIFIATRRGWHACVKLLLRANSELDQCDNRGCSPVCIAAFRNRFECLSLLLDARADPSSSWEGKSAFEIAQREGHVECVRLLESAMQ
jgi:hypothetical protein